MEGKKKENKGGSLFDFEGIEIYIRLGDYSSSISAKDFSSRSTSCQKIENKRWVSLPRGAAKLVIKERHHQVEIISDIYKGIIIILIYL